MKISLQSTLVKHMAVYPEKLVESLIKRGIPDEGTICDPFAGSGTTGKAVLNLNGFNLLFSRNIARKFIMIEGNRDFVDIIVKRTAFNSKRVEHVPRKETSIKPALRIKPVDITEKYRAKHHIDFLFSRSTIKIIEDTQDKEALFRTLISSRAKETFPDDGILYMGLKNVSLLDFYHLSQIIDHGWVIRNMLVIVQEDQGNKNWFPVFFIVKDQKRKKYRFNLDNIRIQHKHDTNETWKDTDFHNFRVVDRFSSKNEQLDGIITELRSVHSDGMPEKVVISWNDGKTSLEYVIHEEDWWDNLLIACPICNGAILDKEMFFFKLKCPNCGKILWNGLETLPEFKEQDDSTMVSLPEKSVDKDNTVTKRTSRNRNYNGKFIGTKRINLGQSPGARASTQEMFFSVVRRYNINQPLVCDLLNFYRNNKNLTKKALTERFSPEYIHTVGHWLRKDMGGSIPTPTDLTTLATILDIPEDYVTLLNRRGLKLQTVKKSVKGKNPGDFLEGDINEIKKILAKSIR